MNNIIQSVLDINKLRDNYKIINKLLKGKDQTILITSWLST